MKRRYVLIRFYDGQVYPALIESETNKYVTIGNEVMLAETSDTAIVVSEMAGYTDSDAMITKIAELFEMDENGLDRITGIVNRTYWGDENE